MLLILISKYFLKCCSLRPVGNYNSNKHVELVNPHPAFNLSLILLAANVGALIGTWQSSPVSKDLLFTNNV